MKIKYIIVIGIIFLFITIFNDKDKNNNKNTNKLDWFIENREIVSWEGVKDGIKPKVNLTLEFGKPKPLSLASLGWEDGLNISSDWLNLYSTYLPLDFFSFVINKDSLKNLDFYNRWPTFDMNFTDNPTWEDFLWYHSDILYSHRNSALEEFPDWKLSNMKRNIFSEGAPNPIFIDSDNIDIMAFTSNDKDPTYDIDIWFINNTNKNPSWVGEVANWINSEYIEDNPHIERIDNNNLILFFDSDNKPWWKGNHDIWYSRSSNNWVTWSNPSNDISINTDKKEHQPHLYKTKNWEWYLYFSAFYDDGKLAIFRSKQNNINDWKNWWIKELVISSGNSEWIWEPSLTDSGDLYFVTIYKNSNWSKYDKYDSDPWFLPNNQ